MRARRSGSRLRYVVQLRHVGFRAANSSLRWSVGRLILHPFYAETQTLDCSVALLRNSANPLRATQRTHAHATYAHVQFLVHSRRLCPCSENMVMHPDAPPLKPGSNKLNEDEIVLTVSHIPDGDNKIVIELESAPHITWWKGICNNHSGRFWRLRTTGTAPHPRPSRRITFRVRPSTRPRSLAYTQRRTRSQSRAASRRTTSTYYTGRMLTESD